MSTLTSWLLPCTSCVCVIFICVSLSINLVSVILNCVCLLSLSHTGRVSFFSSGSENIHRVEKVTWGTRYAITVSFTCDPEHAISDPALHWVTRRRRCCPLAQTSPATETRRVLLAATVKTQNFSATFKTLAPRLSCKRQMLTPSFLKWWFLIFNHRIYFNF